MDWDLSERYRATLVFLGLALVSFLLLAFPRSSPVRHLKAILVRWALPTERFLSQTTVSMAPPAAGGPSDTVEQARALHVLMEENRRLRQLLNLIEHRWPSAVVAQVVGRSPQRWFQEILLDKGQEDGLDVDEAVIALSDHQEGLVGRVVEVGPHLSKVMLIYDSLSSVAATVADTASEDGLVEGTNSHDLFFKFLRRDSAIKIGDLVVTSGLGHYFQKRIPVGWVQDIGPDPRGLFLQARLRPAFQSNALRVVIVLVHGT